jgi:4-amino-4-deoxy-L-arabinose transferase-like glycosyltransferase
MNEESELEEYALWLVILITLIGGFLRVLLLAEKGMWLDETFSVWMASHSIPDMLQWIVRIDQHPPLYYVLLHYWIAFTGDTAYDVRLLSALFGTAAIPIIYLIGKRMSGVVMGLAAALILALSPFHIYFAQETRMYTLLTFNAAVAIYALVRLLTDARSVKPIGSQFREYLHTWRTAGTVTPKAEDDSRYVVAPPTGWRAWLSRHRWAPIQTIETDLAWVVLIVFSAATMLTHNTAVLFPIAANVFVLGLMLFQRTNKSGSQPGLQTPSWGNWVKAQIGIFVLWSPWLFFFIKQASAVDQRFWIPEPTWDAVLQALRSFLNASAPIPAIQSTVIWSLYVLVLGLGVVHFRQKMSRFLFLAVLFTVPFLGELLVSIRRPIFYDRTLIWTTIPLFVLLAAGVAQFRYRFLVVAVVGILGAINLFSVGDYYRFYQKEDWSTAAGYVANFAEKDDLVLFNSNFVVIPFGYYFKPYEDLYSIQVKKQGIPLDLFDSDVLEPEMTESDIPKLLSLLRGHDRVWLVYSHDAYTDPTGLIPQTLAAQMRLTRRRDFHGGYVQLYENP